MTNYFYLIVVCVCASALECVLLILSMLGNGVIDTLKSKDNNHSTSRD